MQKSYRFYLGHHWAGMELCCFGCTVF